MVMCSGNVGVLKYNMTDCVFVSVSVSGLYFVSLSALSSCGWSDVICSLVTTRGTACIIAFVYRAVGVNNSTFICVLPKDLVVFIRLYCAFVRLTILRVFVNLITLQGPMISVICLYVSIGSNCVMFLHGLVIMTVMLFVGRVQSCGLGWVWM